MPPLLEVRNLKVQFKTQDGVVTQLANRTITLADGASSNQSVDISLPLPNQTAVITITLPDQNQQIHFETKS